MISFQMKDNKEQINILIVDDHKLIREGIKEYLNAEPCLKVVAEAENGEEAFRLVNENDIHVVLMDIDMPRLNGIQASKEIKSSNPEVHILVLTMLHESQHIRQMLQAGASGYLLKSCSRDELIKAITKVAKGDTFFCKEVTKMLIEIVSRQSKPPKSKFRFAGLLTNREKEILQYVILQYSNREIADKLFISVRTVEVHKRNLIEKTGSKNIVGLVLYVWMRRI